MKYTLYIIYCRYLWRLLLRNRNLSRHRMLLATHQIIWLHHFLKIFCLFQLLSQYKHTNSPKINLDFYRLIFYTCGIYQFCLWILFLGIIAIEYRLQYTKYKIGHRNHLINRAKKMKNFKFLNIENHLENWSTVNLRVQTVCSTEILVSICFFIRMTRFYRNMDP